MLFNCTSHLFKSKKAKVNILLLWPWLLVGLISTGCSQLPRTEAEAQPRSPQPGAQSPRPTAVDVAIARVGVLREAPTYIGTTRPVREISLRSQVEGRLFNLTVDAGDRVVRGQILAQLDDALLRTAVSQAEAELAARQSEVLRAQTQVNNAKARAEQARVELQQAQTDAKRRELLWKEGAISKQQAELALTEARTKEQILRAAEEQIRTEEQAVAAAQGRVAAQRATLAQTKERLTYARLASPINGVVLEKVSEPGNLVQPGGEILKIGDFSRVKITVPVSELELSKIQVGQSADVRLDAFPNRSIAGVVSRISPAADASARQIPVEVTIPNNNGQIGSGLLARVSFSRLSRPTVIVPQTAVQQAGAQRGPGAEGQGRRGSQGQRGPGAEEKTNSGLRTQDSGLKTDSGLSTLFVVTGEGNEVTVMARQVTVGDRANGNVEILSGLQPGERFVVRSERPLKEGEAVRLSVLSETGS